MSEQKVWVEKVPEVCEECPYIEKFDGQCKLSGRIMNYNQMYRKVRKVCPLRSIKDNNRELVAEVLEKVKKELDGDYNQYRINHILDQIQKEYEK